MSGSSTCQGSAHASPACGCCGSQCAGKAPKKASTWGASSAAAGVDRVGRQPDGFPGLPGAQQRA
ncbi:hypothetical protein LP419_36575 [Massilia sp. H-1]|nr:hypothetical protein LP419_36575 [Massilia sp. H-1]